MANVIIKKSEAQGKILSEAQKETRRKQSVVWRFYRLAEKFKGKVSLVKDVSQYKRAVDELDAVNR